MLCQRIWLSGMRLLVILLMPAHGNGIFWLLRLKFLIFGFGCAVLLFGSLALCLRSALAIICLICPSKSEYPLFCSPLRWDYGRFHQPRTKLFLVSEQSLNLQQYLLFWLLQQLMECL